jgi:hypothetical protein
MHSRKQHAVAIAALTALLLAGCSMADPTPAPPSATTDGPAAEDGVLPAPRDTHSPAPAEPRPSSTPLEPSGADEVPTATPLPKPTPTRNPMHSAMEVDIDTAVEIVDDFWHTHWSDYFPGNYESPVFVAPIRAPRRNTQTGPSRGGTRSTAPSTTPCSGTPT